MFKGSWQELTHGGSETPKVFVCFGKFHCFQLSNSTSLRALARSGESGWKFTGSNLERRGWECGAQENNGKNWYPASDTHRVDMGKTLIDNFCMFWGYRFCFLTPGFSAFFMFFSFFLGHLCKILQKCDLGRRLSVSCSSTCLCYLACFHPAGSSSWPKSWNLSL